MSSPRTQRSLAPRGERPVGSARRKARWLRAERDLLAPRTSRVALLGLSGLNPKGESFTTLFIIKSLSPIPGLVTGHMLDLVRQCDYLMAVLMSYYIAKQAAVG